jgi:hypothetical protein
VNIALSRGGAALAAATLVASSLLVTAAAASAVTDGKIVVSVVDQFGRPTIAMVQPFDTSGLTHQEDGTSPSQPFTVASTHSYTVPPGDYSFESIGPWSGIDCFEVAPCGYTTPPDTYGAAVTVTSGETATYTVHVSVPVVAGAGTVGSPLTVQLPQHLTDLMAVIDLSPFGGEPISHQWLRSGADIPGATGASYTTVPADGARSIAARLVPSSGQTLLFRSTGYTVQPFTTDPIAIAPYTPAKTKTKVKVAKRISTGERATMKVRVKSRSGVPDGVVKIRVGKFRTEQTLEDGRLLFTLPRLGPGTYRITVKYAGSDYFTRSRDKAKIKIHR